MGENGKVGNQERATAPDSLTNQPNEEVEVAPSKSSKSPAFQLYPAEFLGSHNVIKMPMTERGAYITLLCRCWLNSGLPTDMTVLADYCDMKPDRFERMWKHGRIGRCFYEKNGKFQNERLDDERKKQAEYRRRQSDRAKERWNKANDATASHGITPASHGKASSSFVSSDLVSSGSDPSRSGSIIKRRRLDAALEFESGIYVPQRLFDDFTALHPNEDMSAWFESVNRAWSGRRTGADMFKFWKARHDETWPPEIVSSREPAWAR